MAYDRRKFITFLGKASLGAWITPPFLINYGGATTPINTERASKENLEALKQLTLEALAASDKDDLLLTKGLDYHTIIKWGDKISEQDTFGFNNDFTCFIPLDEKNPKDGLLWVNHEYV
ncbi:MAG: alkaline phosphatase PhoX, partial [Bacteroidota bacterium]